MWAQQEPRSPSRIVTGAGSLKSPGKRGGADFFSKAVSKGLPRPFHAAGWRCYVYYVTFQKAQFSIIISKNERNVLKCHCHNLFLF
jgi:hypothetical protein